MRTWRRAYAFTICFLSMGLVWVYLDVRRPIHRHRSTFYVLDYLKTDTLERSGQSLHTRQTTVGTTTQFDSVNQTSTANTQIKHRPHTTTPSSKAAHTNPEVAQESKIKQTHIVAIVSYMRSGSTLTADIQQHFPGTIYVFEPLHAAVLRINSGQPLMYINGTHRLLAPKDITDEFLKEELHKWMSCRYSELDVHSLTDTFHTSFSRSMRKFTICWKNKTKHPITPLRALRLCLPKAIERCEKAKHRLFKFIRLPMRIIKQMMPLYPNLQIIHLIRDPRGSLMSRIHVNKFSVEEVGTKAKNLCSNAIEDLKYSYELTAKYPTRAKILLYETLANDPINVTESIYKFTRRSGYQYGLRYVAKLTTQGKHDSTAFTIIRGNSSKTAFHWRDKINFTSVVEIDNQCQELYNVLGYKRLYTEEDVRNHNIQVHLTPNRSSFIS